MRHTPFEERRQNEHACIFLSQTQAEDNDTATTDKIINNNITNAGIMVCYMDIEEETCEITRYAQESS
jgi:hypothetical protein